MAKKPQPRDEARRDKAVSLHPLTPEEALKLALNTPLPDSAVRRERETEPDERQPKPK